MTQQELIEALTPLVRAADLSAVVLALARVCNEEAEFYGHGLSARRWNAAAETLDRVSESVTAC